MRRSKIAGIALIQVLIISIILAMLGIYISQTVRSQVKVASVVKSAQQYTLDIESAEAELFHKLLTEPTSTFANRNSEIKGWNLHNKPFLLNDKIQVQIQDISGLISLNHINRRLAQNLFYQLGLPDEKVRTFLDALADWKDRDDLKHLNGAESDEYLKSIGHGVRNSYLQSFAEIKLIKQGNMLSLRDWRRYFSLALISSFNPLNAPNEILKVFIEDEQAYNEVIKLRAEQQLNGLTFFQATGIDEDDFISFRTGRLFKVTLSTLSEDSYINKSFVVELKSNSIKRPVTVFEVTWNNT